MTVTLFKNASGKLALSIAATIAAAMSLSVKAIAQVPSNWTVTPQENGSTIYSDPATGASVVVVPTPAQVDIPAEELLTQVVDRFSNNPLCSGLANAPIEETGNVILVRTENDLGLCSILASEGSNGMVALAIEPTGANAQTIDIARSLFGNDAATPQPQPNPIAIDPSNLPSALEAVPPEHRPIAVVSRSSTSFMGGMPIPSFSQWMVFANGYATDCYEWDPATTAPTPSTLPSECEVVSWRKAGNLYQFQDDDGTWEEPEDYGVLLDFQPGETINVDLVRKSGAGSPEVNGISVGSISSGVLQMTPDSTITLGNWTSVVVSGSNVGGGSTRSEGPVTGRYYLDGYLIAIAGEDGIIRRGFIAGDRESSGFYIYLNGDLYWERE